MATALKSLQEEFKLNMNQEQNKIMEKNEFDIDEFKRVMTKATAENERLKKQNKELNDDIVEIQGLVGSFQESQQSNDSIIMQLRTLEEQNVRHSESIKEKNTLLAQFAERIEAMKVICRSRSSSRNLNTYFRRKQAARELSHLKTCEKFDWNVIKSQKEIKSLKNKLKSIKLLLKHKRNILTVSLTLWNCQIKQGKK